MRHPGGRRRVAVTGLGAITPAGVGAEPLLELVLSGQSAIAPIRAFDAAGHASRIAAEIPGEQIGGWRTGEPRFVQLARGCADQALSDSGIDLDALDCGRAGVVVGTAIAGTEMTAEHFGELTADGTAPVGPAHARDDLPAMATFNSAAAAVAAGIGLGGPCFTVVTGCTAGNDALGLAAGLVRGGSADVMLAGAAEAPITPLALACFDAIGALSTRNDEPHIASRPFDRDRDGFVLAEGGAIAVLEELEHARRRGAHVYCEVAGFASTSNATHMTDLAEDGADLARALGLSLASACRLPADLDYVNAHGSSTPQNDVCETNAIKLVLRDQARRLPVSSIKGSVGHALAAANALEFVTSAVVVERGVIPPTANLETPGRGCDLDYVPGDAREQPVELMASLASGFGGIHSSIVLARSR